MIEWWQDRYYAAMSRAARLDRLTAMALHKLEAGDHPAALRFLRETKTTNGPPPHQGDGPFGTT